MVKKGYKQTEAGLIPEDWDTITFRDCFEILPNNTLSRAELNYNGGKVKNIHYGDVLIKFPSVLDCSNEMLPYVNPECVSKCSTMVLQDGDIIIADTAEDNTVGKATEVIGIGEQRIVSGLHTIPCRPKQKDRFADKWLGYFINHSVYHNQLLPFITGIKVSSISKSAIADTIIAIPEKAEQERIVAALSDMDELICSLEKLIAKKKYVREGAMQELLTQKKEFPFMDNSEVDYRIGDIGDFYSGLTGKSKDDFGTGNAKYITFLNVLSNSIIDISILERVNVEDGESQNAARLGDLFFNTSSETPEEVGMCAVLLDDVRNVYLNSFCFGYRIKSKDIDPLFFSYYFNSQEGRKIMSVLAQGATRYNLSKSYFADTIVSFPKYEKQKLIAQILHDMDTEIKSLQSKLEKYRQMKSGMMDALLTGKVRLV